MTGGGRGYCAVNLTGKGTNPAAGQGFLRRGGGRGRRNCFYATGLPGWMRTQKGMQALGGFGRSVSRDDELAVLKDKAAYFKEELDAVQARVQALESK
jgi:hypothetical protein